MEIWNRQPDGIDTQDAEPALDRRDRRDPALQYGGRFLAAVLKARDRVQVYAVNPRYDEIMGIPS